MSDESDPSGLELPDGSQMRDRQRVTLWALTVAAFALRLLHLTRLELFVDEAATWWFAKLAAGGRLAEQMSLEPTPPLFYLLVGLLMKVFGESELVLRLPSAVFGAAAVPLVFILGRELFDRRVGWIAAVLLAVHPLHVFYSREARVYPLLLCFTLLILIVLWRAVEHDAWRDWVALGGLLAVACYSHFYGLFLLLTASLVVLFWAPKASARWRGLLAIGLAAAVFAPYVLATLPHLQASGAAWSIETFYRDHPRELGIDRVVESQLIGAGYHPYLRELDRPPTPLMLRASSVGAQVFLLGLALYFGMRQGKARPLAFLLVTWLVPVLAPWSVTHLGRAIFHAGRHDVYAAGSLSVLLAVGLAGLLATRPQRLVALALALAVFAGAVFRLTMLSRVPVAGLQREAGEWIAQHSGPEDRVLAFGIRRLVTEHATRQVGGDVPFESFPASTDNHPGWSDVMTLLQDQAPLHVEARGKINNLERQLKSDGLLFLLARPYQRTEDAVSATWLVDRHILENLRAAGWRPEPELSFPAARIEVFRPPARRVDRVD